MLNFNHLHYFHVVATEGSIAAAASRLGVTQPTVSEQLRALERALDVNLFERLPSGLRLTESGRLAYEQTSVMFRAGERLLEVLVPPDAAHNASTLRVGLSTSMARATTSELLMPLLSLEACLPDIQTAPGVELVRAVRSNELDLALIDGEPTDSARRGLVSAPVDRIRLVAIGPVGLSPAKDWSDVKLLHHRPTSPYRFEVDTFLEKQGLKPTIVAEADDPTFLLEAAARGGYVTIVPRSVARDAIVAKRVAQIARFEEPSATIFALHGDGAAAALARRAVAALVAKAEALGRE